MTDTEFSSNDVGRGSPDYSRVPGELLELQRWICWRLEERNGRKAKVPYTTNGGAARVNAPADWTHHPMAVWGAGRYNMSGVGFVLHEDDPYSGIDFDGCLDDGGAVVEWAAPWLERLKGLAYIETSPSGTGVKAWVRGKLPKAVKIPMGGEHTGIEVYSKGRYFCVTGRVWGEVPARIGEAQAVLDDLAALAGERAEPDPEPPPTGSRASRGYEAIVAEADGDSYSLAALEKECARVANAPRATGNNTLASAAFNIGQLVGAYRLDADDARAALLSAALGRNPPIHDAADTIDRQIREGMAKPRDPGVGEAGRSRPSRDADAAPVEWGPLKIGNLPPVPPFPLDVVPKAVADLATAVESVGKLAADAAALACLATAAGVVGRSVSLLLRPGHFASASIYCCIVGDSGIGKTPTLKPVGAPVFKIERELADEHRRLDAEWKVGAKGKKADDATRPVPRRLVLDNITMAAVPSRMSGNDRGLIVFKDELSGFMGGLNQFTNGKGNDREAVLAMWSGAPICKDRVSDENGVPIRVPHPCLSIVGGIVPDGLNCFIDPARPGDGFIERFLFTYPDRRPSPGWVRQGVPDALESAWGSIVRRLWMRNMNQHPRVARMTATAETAWAAAYDAHDLEADRLGEAWGAAWAKLADYAGRLALVLALLEYAATEYPGDLQSVPDVDERHVLNAWRLVDYFKAHHRRVRAVIDPTGSGPRAGLAGALLKWLKAERPERFTARDFLQNRRSTNAEALREALDDLTAANAIRPAPRREGPGRRTAEFEANPALWETQPRDADSTAA